MKKAKHQQSVKIPKTILYTAKVLETISPKLATQFAINLFTKPIRHKLPKREIEMDADSKQQLVKINAIDKEIMLYQYGSGEKKVLLIHGASRKGSQV